jgi:hypothetical protein
MLRKIKAWGVIRTLAFASIMMGVITIDVNAQDESELAKQSQNPVSDLINVPFQNNFSFGAGSKDKMIYVGCPEVVMTPDSAVEAGGDLGATKIWESADAKKFSIVFIPSPRTQKLARMRRPLKVRLEAETCWLRCGKHRALC